MVVQNISLDGKETDLTFTIKSEDLKKTEKLKNLILSLDHTLKLVQNRMR